MRLSLVVVVVAALGCGKGTDSTAPAPAPVGSGSGGAGGSAAPPPAADAAAAALSPKIEAAKCGEPCLFLLDAPIAQLTDTYKTKCGGMETKNLGFEDCKQLDYARNCLHAAHGLVYKKKKWKKLFEAKPWYEPHAEVDAKKIAMSEVEHANVHELYLRGKACKKNLKISGADYERIKAWFAALPKPPAPKFAFHWDNNGEDEPSYAPSDIKDFVAFLDDKETKLTSKVRAGKEVFASYEEPKALADDKKLLAAIHVTDPSKLRAIDVNIEIAHGTEDEPYMEEMNMRFIYDDKDQLVAVTGEHVAID